MSPTRKNYPESSREAALWPEDCEPLMDNPVTLEIKLEKPIYLWLIEFMRCSGSLPYLTIEEMIATLIRGLDRDGWSMEALDDIAQNHIKEKGIPSIKSFGKI